MPRVGGKYGSALGFAGGVAVTVAAGSWPALSLVLLAAVVVLVSLCTTVFGAVFAALQCWGLYASFVVGETGQLVFDDHTRWVLLAFAQLAVLATAAAVASTTTFAASTSLGRDRATRPFPARS